MGEVRGVLQVALGSGVGRGGPADVPDALLEERVGLDAADVVQRPPIRCHRGGQIQDPAAGRQNHPEDQYPGCAERPPDPLRRLSRHDAVLVPPEGKVTFETGRAEF